MQYNHGNKAELREVEGSSPRGPEGRYRVVEIIMVSREMEREREGADIRVIRRNLLPVEVRRSQEESGGVRSSGGVPKPSQTPRIKRLLKGVCAS